MWGMIALLAVIMFLSGLAVGVGHEEKPTEQVMVQISPSPSPSPIVQVKEKEVEVRVEVPVIPPDCRDALGLAPGLAEAVSKYEAALGATNRNLEEAHTAIADKDINELNGVVAKQRKLRQDSLGALIEIREKTQQIKDEIKRCQSAQD